MSKTDDLIPSVTWEEVEAMFLSMADTPTKSLMVHHLVEGTRKQAPFLTPRGVMTEICYIAVALLDPTFRAGASNLDDSSSGASSPSSESPP